MERLQREHLGRWSRRIGTETVVKVVEEVLLKHLCEGDRGLLSSCGQREKGLAEAERVGPPASPPLCVYGR